MRGKKYSGRRLYQYHEDEFLLSLSVDKFTSNQRNFFNLTPSLNFYVYAYPLELTV